MLEARNLLEREKVEKSKYSGEVLYNVLMENHDKMIVNNMICETLNPENRIVKIRNYLKEKKLNPNKEKKLIKKINKIYTRENNFI
jgi:glutathionyl-hydroquinone reductase